MSAQPSPSPDEISARALELWRLAGSLPGQEQKYREAAIAELQKHAELTERSGGLDFSSYEAISLGTRRVAGSTSPGTDVFGRGEWENSLLYEFLVNHGFVPQGHSPDVEPSNPILYVGQQIDVDTEADVTATPTP